MKLRSLRQYTMYTRVLDTGVNLFMKALICTLENEQRRSNITTIFSLVVIQKGQISYIYIYI